MPANVVMFAVILSLLNPTPLLATTPHDVPDGQIERAVAVVVRGRSIEVSYQIGISPNTTRDQLLAWQVAGVEDLMGEDEDAELSRLFCESLETRLGEGLAISVDGTELETAVVEVAPFAMHHKAAVVKITAELPDSADEIDLVVVDSNWSEMPGGARYAIKGRGNTLLTESNVAPIIIRAQRNELDELQPEERVARCTIRATVKVLAEPEK